jgi:AraC-like DNA-binding protein
MPNPFRKTEPSGYGLKALFGELTDQGVSQRAVLGDAGVRSLAGTLTQAQRLAILRAAKGLAIEPLTALHAGQRQRVHHFGVYGFALATSPTFYDAFMFGRQHIELAGAVLQISFHTESRVGVLRSENPAALGSLLPFAAEFWRSSMTTLLSEVLGKPFPSVLMRFPYPAPVYAKAYRSQFDCPIEFDSPTMEWHFDANILKEPCASASSVTATICQDFCESMIQKAGGSSPLQRDLRAYMLGNTGRRTTAEDAAAAVGLAKRTLFRRLQTEGISFQTLLDQTRSSLAREYLESTRLGTVEIADRCGYGDEANFRKAFQRWQGISPSQWRLKRGQMAGKDD